TNSAANDTTPAWSPDGSKLAFVSDLSESGNPDIYSMKADGTGILRLTNSPLGELNPSWSPDATHFTFTKGACDPDLNCSGDAFLGLELFVMNANGGNQTQLTNNSLADAFPDWSPNGSSIAFARADASCASGQDDQCVANIYAMDANGANQHSLTNNSSTQYEAAYSPDGSKIAYTRQTKDLAQNLFTQSIYVMNADGTGQTKLTPDSIDGEKPTWSPDGTKIAVGCHLVNESGSQICVLNADGTGLAQVTSGDTVSRALPSWQHFSISGRITSGTSGVSDVTVTLGGTSSGTTKSDANGVYVFGNLQPGGNYSVTPVSNDLIFNPVTTNVNNLSGKQSADFTASGGFTISGQAKNTSGIGIAGVAINLTGSSNRMTTTDNNGNYSFGSLSPGGNYTVTPSSSSYSFSPPNQTFNNLNVNRTAIFVGEQTAVGASGKVTDSNNAGLSNVTVALTKNGLAAGLTQTDAQGNYSFVNLTVGANYIVTPVGSFTPSSQVFNDLTTNVTANFKATPSIPPQCSTASFAGAAPFGAGANPSSVALGDFNGDGKIDLAVANSASGNVSILLGTGTGTFGAATNFAVGTTPVSVAVGDFNGDSKLDLAVANQDSQTISILLGNGAGSFSGATNFGTGTLPVWVAIGDFNGDGKLDLAVTNRGSNNVSI